MNVADLLFDMPDLITPQPGLLMPVTPLPSPRPLDALPSVEELIASEHIGDELALSTEEPESYGSN